MTRRRRPASVPRGTSDRMRLTRELLTAFRLLIRGRHGAQEWADACGLERRSAYRMLRSLELAGLRIEHQREGRRVYLVAPREEVEAWLWERPLTSPRARALPRRPCPAQARAGPR